MKHRRMVRSASRDGAAGKQRAEFHAGDEGIELRPRLSGEPTRSIDHRIAGERSCSRRDRRREAVAIGRRAAFMRDWVGHRRSSQIMSEAFSAPCSRAIMLVCWPPTRSEQRRPTTRGTHAMHARLFVQPPPYQSEPILQVRPSGNPPRRGCADILGRLGINPARFARRDSSSRYG